MSPLSMAAIFEQVSRHPWASIPNLTGQGETKINPNLPSRSPPQCWQSTGQFSQGQVTGLGMAPDGLESGRCWSCRS